MLLLVLNGDVWRSGQVECSRISSSHVKQLMAQLELAYTIDLERIKAEHKSHHPGKISTNELSDRSYYDSEFVNPFEAENNDEEAEVTPGFFEGDMVYLPSEVLSLRIAVNSEKFAARKWPNATVPYIISPKYAQAERVMIKKAIAILNFVTCVNFVPWDGQAEDFLLIWPVSRPAGCFAFVGRVGGAQIVSLQPPDARSARCFASVGKPLHELIHSIGFFHEQARSDRDQYVRVLDQHIINRFKRNFSKLSPLNTTVDYTYDYGSVMHYGARYFSKDGSSPTIVPLQNGTVIGQRNGLSVRDCLKINSHYGCLHRSPFHQMKYRMLCRMLGTDTGATTFL